jgi:hypothetical protein
MSVRSRLIAPIAALAAAFVIASCGSDDFENNSRPPAPIELTARIGDDDVSVSPNSAKEVAAGTATITISNQSRDPATLVLEGPTDDQSGEIIAGGTGDMKIQLEEGDYTVSAQDSGAREGKLQVGPAGKSSQNDLLLP